MRFRDAALRQNTQPLVDAYTGAALGLGQLLPYDDSRRDSVNTMRRMLSVEPGLAMPARGAVSLGGKAYLVGTAHTDFFRGQALRSHHVLHETHALGSVRTAGQLATNTAGTPTYCALSFIKHMAYEQLGSDLVPEYYVYVAGSETAGEGAFVQLGGDHFIVRAASQGETGLKLLTCEQLHDSALCNVTYSTGTYDRVTETRTTGQLVTTGVLVRWQAMFRYAHPESPKLGAGCVILLMSPTVPVGTDIEIAGRRYLVRWAAPADGCTAYTLVDHGTA